MVPLAMSVLRYRFMDITSKCKEPRKVKLKSNRDAVKVTFDCSIVFDRFLETISSYMKCEELNIGYSDVIL